MSATMQSILKATNREIDWTLLLLFPDNTSFKYSSAPLPYDSTYKNELEKDSEIFQTLESPTDGVSFAIQNKNRLLGLHLATYWQKWRKAKAVVGRYYRDKDGLGLAEWTQMFEGMVQRPNANDFQVTFDIVPETRAAGNIVCNRTLALQCGFVYKHPKTCASPGNRPSCDHHLKSGCEEDENTHHFGGMEHNYPPEQTAPGASGNGGDIIFHDCPRLDQFVLVRGSDGLPMAKMVCFLTEEDWLFNPIKGTFHKIQSAEIVRNVPIFEFVSSAGAVSFSSFSHLLIRSEEDNRGLAVSKFEKRAPVMNWIDGNLLTSKTALAQDAGEMGDVMRIEMEDGHISASGDSEDKMNLFHNFKNPVDPT